MKKHGFRFKFKLSFSSENKGKIKASLGQGKNFSLRLQLCVKCREILFVCMGKVVVSVAPIFAV